MTSSEFPHDDAPITGSAERWNNMGKTRKYGGAVVALVKSLRGDTRMEDRMDADRHAAFVQKIADAGAEREQADMLKRAAEVVNSQGLTEMPDGMPPQSPQVPPSERHE